jgi:hypothetical protein
MTDHPKNTIGIKLGNLNGEHGGLQLFRGLPFVSRLDNPQRTESGHRLERLLIRCLNADPFRHSGRRKYCKPA